MDKNKYYMLLFILCAGLFLSVLSSPPIFYDKFIYSKWLVVYLTSIFSLIIEIYFFDFKKKFIKFSFPKKLIIGSFVLIAGYSLSAFLNFNEFYLSQLLDWLCFLQVFYTAFTLFKENFHKTLNCLKWTSNFLVLIILISFLIYISKNSFSYRIAYSDLFFGNKNLLAEFLGASFVIQLFSFENKYKNTYCRNSSIFFLLITCILIGGTLSRSTWLGCQLFSLYFLFINRQLRRTNFYQIIVGISIFSFICYPAFKNIYSRYDAVEVNGQKNVSVDVRKTRWINSLYMIPDNLFGVGPGNYEFTYTKYHSRWREDSESFHENIIVSPHNAFLELLIEGGVITFIGLIFLLYSFAKIKKEKSQAYYLSIGYLILFSVDAMFAFPLETGVSFYIFSIFFGLYLTSLKLYETNFYFKNRSVFLVKVVMIFILMSLTSLSFTSHFFEYHFYDDLEKIKIACNIFPENWRSCIRKAEIEMETGQFDDSIATIQKILKKNPNNFVAIDILGKVYWKMGDIEKSCESVHRFDKIFLSKSHLHAFYEANCLGMNNF